MNPLLELFDNDADIVETVAVTPAGSTVSTSGITARVVRESADTIQTGQDTHRVTRSRVKILATVHATYKGLAAPAVGDNWTLARVQGGTACANWIAGAPIGRAGFWEIPVELVERIESGKTRTEGNR